MENDYYGLDLPIQGVESMTEIRDTWIFWLRTPVLS